MQRYKKYKDSGIEWLGEIPEGWEVKRLSYCFNNIGSGTTPTSGASEYYLNGNINWLQTGDLKDSEIVCTSKKVTLKALEDYSTLRKYPVGSIVIAMYGATIGKTGLLQIETTTNQACCVLAESKGVNSKYAFYWLNSIKKHIISFSYGGGQPNINQEIIKSLKVQLPPKPEQTAIANYLDHKTAEIDQLIVQKKRLLELYDEEKTAIINRAVIRGINPDVKLKDSGIEWLGEIPEGWEVKRLKYIADANPSNIDKKSKDNECPVLLCNYVDVYKNEFISSRLAFMKATAREDQIKKFVLKKGDVIATKDSETPNDIAAPALVVDDFDNVVCGYHLTRIKPIQINGDYLFRYFQTKYLSSYFEVSANGVTRYGLGVDKFNSALILNPSKPEQTAIIQYIESETTRINAKIAKTEKIIALQKEYRTALISEVVTGKIKVAQKTIDNPICKGSYPLKLGSR